MSFNAPLFYELDLLADGIKTVTFRSKPIAVWLAALYLYGNLYTGNWHKEKILPDKADR